MKRHKIFYGWWIVIALFVVGMLGPMARFSMTAFFPTISAEMFWTRSEIGLAQSISLWIYSLFAILAGIMIDRIGSRKTVFLGGLFCLAGWLLLSTVNQLWQLFIYYGLVMAVAVSMTHLVPLQATQRKWFVKKSGLVGGILVSAVAVGTSIFTPIQTLLADSMGWRATSIASGIAFSLPILLLAFFVIRNKPEAMGLHPDGMMPGMTGQNSRAVTSREWPLKDAIRTPQLWILFIVYSLFGLVVNALMGYLVIWSVDVGSNVAASGIFITLFNAPSILARVGGGWLGDRFPKKKVMAASAVLSLLVMLWGWTGIVSVNQLLIFTVVIGMTSALALGLFVPYLGDLFGKENVGALFGILTMGWGLVGGFGPMLWGILVDATGSYNLACLLSVACYAVAFIALLCIRPLKQRQTQVYTGYNNG